MADQTGPRCGNNPNFRMSDGDRKAVDDFKARLTLQAAVTPQLDTAAWVDGDPLMEVIAHAVHQRCETGDGGIVHDDPRTIAAVAALVARAAEGERPLSPDYSHEACGFHWHGRDGMDIPMRDGQPVCPRCEIEQLREKHKAGLRRADEINNELMAEVQRYAEGTERPVLWSVYNAMHLRAANAESALNRVRTVLETEAVVGRTALEYRGLIASALMADEAEQQDEPDDREQGDLGETRRRERGMAQDIVIALGRKDAASQLGTETQDAQREPHPTEADLRHALAVAAKFHGQDADRHVAYRLGGHSLRCIGCTPSPRGDIWEPVTSNDLPDGGVCAQCGVDVLIPQEPQP